MFISSDKKYKIAHNPILGRHLIAERDLHPGELLIDEPPLVTGPVFNSNNGILPWNDSSEVCLVCCSLINQLNCSCTCNKCSLTLCSTSCIQNPIHSLQECIIFQKLPRNLSIPNRKTLYNFIITIRCLFLRTTNHRFENGVKWAQIQQLESKVKALEKVGTFTEFDYLFGLLRWEFFILSDVPTISEFSSDSNPTSSTTEVYEDIQLAARHCYGVMRTNAFSSFTPSHAREGLYFLSSLMSHSCLMNTDRQMNHERMVTRAAVDIKKGDIITTSYLSYMNATPERLLETRHTWLFDCRCKRCLDSTECGTNLSTVSCPVCNQMTFLPHVQFEWRNNNCKLSNDCNMTDELFYWKCVNESCKHILSQRMTPRSLQLVEASRPFQLENIDEIEIWLTKYCESDNNAKLIHSNHSIFTQIKLYLAQYYGRHSNGISALSTEQLIKKIKYCLEVLSIFNILLCGIYIIRGVLLFELWSGLQEIHRRDADTRHAHHDSAKKFSGIDYSLNQIEKIRADAMNILEYALPNSLEESMAQILRDYGKNTERNCDKVK